MTEAKVYLLDKPIGESWSRDEVSHLVNEYMVEVQQLPALPHRVAAMNAPLGDAQPIFMTWRPSCTLQEVPYSKRWIEDPQPDYEVTGRKFDGMPGNLITEILDRMLACAKGRKGTVAAHLNGVDVEVKDGDTVEERWAWMQAEMDRKRDEYLASDEYKEKCRQAEIEHARVVAARAEIASRAPESMSFADEPTWLETVAKNQDGYGGAVMSYASRWARFMEAEVAAGKTVADCARDMGHLADEEGITGFMYGCAVGILAKVWKHGEELRRWHNKDVQIGSEGDKANESGGVLNPALLSVG